LAWWHTQVGGDGWEPGWERLSEALELGRGADDPQDLREVLWTGIQMLWASPLYDEQAALLAELDSTFEPLSDSNVVGARFLHARFRLEAGDPSYELAAEEAVRRAGSPGLAAKARSDPALHRSQQARAELADLQAKMFRGAFGAVQEQLDEVLASVADTNLRNMALATSFVLAREQGRLRDVLPFAEKMVDQDRALAGFRGAIALAHTDLGNFDDARSRFDALSKDDFAALPRNLTWTASVHLVAETCAILEDPKRAEMLYSLILPYAGHLSVMAGSFLCLGALDRSLGQLAATLQRWDEAQEHYQRGIALEEGLRATALVARSKYWNARMHLRRRLPDDVARGHTLLDDVVQITRAIGMPVLEVQARSLRDEGVETAAS
jgi:tetratricopeptide (TPR) repeat protein